MTNPKIIKKNKRRNRKWACYFSTESWSNCDSLQRELCLNRSPVWIWLFGASSKLQSKHLHMLCKYFKSYFFFVESHSINLVGLTFDCGVYIPHNPTLNPPCPSAVYWMTMTGRWTFLKRQVSLREHIAGELGYPTLTQCIYNAYNTCM